MINRLATQKNRNDRNARKRTSKRTSKSTRKRTRTMKIMKGGSKLISNSGKFSGSSSSGKFSGNTVKPEPKPKSKFMHYVRKIIPLNIFTKRTVKQSIPIGSTTPGKPQHIVNLEELKNIHAKNVLQEKVRFDSLSPQEKYNELNKQKEEILKRAESYPDKPLPLSLITLENQIARLKREIKINENPEQYPAAFVSSVLTTTQAVKRTPKEIQESINTRLAARAALNRFRNASQNAQTYKNVKRNSNFTFTSNLANKFRSAYNLAKSKSSANLSTKKLNLSSQPGERSLSSSTSTESTVLHLSNQSEQTLNVSKTYEETDL